MNESEFKIVQETFGTRDMYMEGVQAVAAGKSKFVGTDGISHQIPEFMKSPATPVPETQPLVQLAPGDSATVPWYRDSEGKGEVNLANYVAPKEPAKLSEEQTDLVYEEQVSNEDLMASLRRRHGNKSNEALLELWAGEQHYINYNIGALAYDAFTLESMTRQEKTDYMLQMETWDRVKAFGDGSQSFWAQLFEIGGALTTDPSTYVGIGTLGAGLLAKSGAKTATKAALISYLRESTKLAAKTGAKIGAVEGLVYGTADSVLHQGIEQKATETIDNLIDTDIDPVRTGIAATVGGVAGAVLGGSLAGGTKAISNRFNEGKIARETLDELVGGTPKGKPQEGEIVTPTATKEAPEGANQGAIQNQVLPYAQLPPNQRKGRPHYKKTPITFENDLQRALFLAGSKKQASKHYAAYVKFAMDQLGASREDVIKIDAKIAKRTGDQTAPLLTDFSYFKMGDSVDGVVSQQGKVVSKAEGEETAVKVDDAVKKAEQESKYDLENSGKTQVSTTVGTYKKVKERYFKDVEPSDVLDYGAGKGKASEELGFDSFEPNPSGWTPMFTDATQITKKYSAIISNAVLNVLPKNVRDVVVKDIASKLAPGGKAYINVRKLVGDIDKTKNPEVFEDGIITSRGTFQKGFNKQELLDYLTEMVGPDYKVEGSPLGALGAIITKLDDEVTAVATTKNAQGNTQSPPMKTTAEQESLAQSMSDVEGANLPTHPSDGAPINLERTAQAIIKNYVTSTGATLNKAVKAAAQKRLMSFKNQKEVQDFLDTYTGKITNLEVDATVVRMLFSSESNKIAKLWTNAKTKTERINALANNPQMISSLKAITVMVQESARSAGRVLQSHNINVNEFNEVLSRVVEAASTIRKVTDAAKAKATYVGSDGAERYQTGINAGKPVDVDGDVTSAFSEKDMDALMNEMEQLLAITADHNDHVRSALPAFRRTEHIWRKFERVMTEIWLAANLSSLATQTGALAGSVIKRSTLKGESYLTWVIGKTFNMEDRLRWNEMKAMNEQDWAQSEATLKMMLRMFRGGTGEGAEGVLQRESLDGWITKWETLPSQGAVNADYVGFADPNTALKSFVNSTLDVAGTTIRSPFTALTLADDMMKRAYYLPRIKYLLTKEANQKLPDSPKAHEAHIKEGIAAYEIFYMKKGMRANTMKRHVSSEMEKFKKDNPDASYDETQAMQLKATEEAEALVQFTPEEHKLLDKVGIDDIKHEQALEHLREMLFQTDIPVDNKTVMGKALGTVKNVRDISPLLQTQLPYLKTVLNMTKDTLQRLPVIGMLSRDMRADIAAGGQKRAEAVSKMLMGSSLIGVGHAMYNNGLITASTDIKNYQGDSAVGVQGASLRIPGTDVFIPLNRIEPVGSFLLFAANGQKMMEEASRLRDIIDAMPVDAVATEDRNTILSFIEDYTLVLGSLAAKLFTEKSGATSVKRLMNVLQNPESDSSQQWVKQYGTGFIPLHAGIKQLFEGDVNYEAKTWSEHVRKKLGLMGEKYGDRDTIDLLGGVNNDIKRLGGIHWRTSVPKKGDVVLATLYELQPGLRRADSTIQLKNGITVDLTYKQVYELRTLMAHSKIDVRGRLAAVIRKEAFKKLPTGTPGESGGYGKHTKIQVIRAVYNQSKRDAQDLYVSIHRDEIRKVYAKEILNSKVAVANPGSNQRTKVLGN